MRRRLSLLLALACAVPLTARGVHAQELLTNPSFESGISGYTTNASGGAVVGPVIGLCSLTPNFGSGTGCAGIIFQGTSPTAVSPATTGSLQQLVGGLTVGQLYEVSILYRFGFDLGADLFLQFAGNALSLPNAINTCAVGVVCQLKFTTAATATSELFAVGINRGPTSAPYMGGAVTFDQASVTAFVAPEPGTWALLATGLLGLAGVARRRRAAA